MGYAVERHFRVRLQPGMEFLYPRPFFSLGMHLLEPGDPPWLPQLILLANTRTLAVSTGGGLCWRSAASRRVHLQVSSNPSSADVKRSEHGVFTLLLKTQRQKPLYPASRILTLQYLIAANRPLRKAAVPSLSEGEGGGRAFQSGLCTSSSVVPSAANTPAFVRSRTEPGRFA